MTDKINIDESAARIAAQLDSTPIAQSTTQEPIQTKNLDGTIITDDADAQAKADEAEATRVAAETAKQAEIEANNKSAADAKAVEDAKKKDAEIKDADIDAIDEDALEELSDEDRAYMDEISGKKEKNPEGKKEVTKDKVKDAEDIAPLKQKASEYEKILADPLTKAFLDFRKEGGQDLAEFSKKIGISDVGSLTPEQLYEQDLKGMPELSEDEVADEMAKFQDLSKVEKLRLTKDIKSKLFAERDEKLKTFSVNVNKEAEAYKAFEQQAISKGVTELGDVLTKMEGKKYKGLTVTPEMANEIRQYVTQNTVVKLNEDGSFIGYDIEKSVSNAMKINYGDDMIKVAAKMAKAYGMDKALKLRQRPNKMDSTSNQIPIAQKDIKDYAKDAGNDQWKARGYKS